MAAYCFALICGAVPFNFERIFHALRPISYGILIIFLLIISFPFLLALIARLEKQMIHCFEPCDENDISCQSDYTKAVNKSAAELGFLFCGWFQQNRGGIYQATLTAWLSPDFHILLIVAGGKTAGVNLKKMFFCSGTIDGPVLMTCDESKLPDLSGLIEMQVLWNANLQELYNLHLSRIAPWQNDLEIFNPDSVLEDYELFEQKQVRILVNAGLAEYLDYNQNEWRYTWKGAFALRTRFIKSLKKDKLQAYRFGLEFERRQRAVKLHASRRKRMQCCFLEQKYNIHRER